MLTHFKQAYLCHCLVKKAEKEITVTELENAKRDFETKRRFEAPGGSNIVLSGQEQLWVRLYARKMLPIAKMRQPKITEEQFYAALRNLIQTRHPKVRESLLASIKQSIDTPSEK